MHPKIRDFYERTPAYRLDTWATTYFPARLALWALVTTISRRVQQLNFPLDGLETALGMRSEIVLLRRPDRSIRYTGWFRTLEGSGRVIYTGYYMTEKPPVTAGPCVKVVFPMPDGNATVLLRPENDGESGLRLASIGSAFGDAGFYRVQRAGPGEGAALRVWRITESARDVPAVSRFRGHRAVRAPGAVSGHAGADAALPDRDGAGFDSRPVELSCSCHRTSRRPSSRCTRAGSCGIYVAGWRELHSHLSISRWPFEEAIVILISRRTP